MIICIYHGNCADGFTAAWVVRKALGDDVQFHAGKYGEAPPDVTGKAVYIVDFSYPRDVLTAMAALAFHIVVLDHHKTARESLDGLAVRNLDVIFDMHRSGSRIAWDYFFPDQEPPRLLQHVEDRDLWRFDLEGTREVQAALFSYPYDFKVWDRMMASDQAVEALYHDGIPILRMHQKNVEELVKAFRRRMVIGGYNVPVANLPYTMTSDAGALMAEDEPFAACYWETPAFREFSLRSREGGIDVALIAQQYGGGGHRNAAGFRVPYGHPLTVSSAEEG